jgi:hypothetical protein
MSKISRQNASNSLAFFSAKSQSAPDKPSKKNGHLNIQKLWCNTAK